LRFAVSGDSRNCGDIVMPAIAAGARKDGAEFYWHLGDLRAMYDFDIDITKRAERGGKPLSITEYQNMAWPDFIQNQIGAFGNMPFFLGIGNHELVPPKTRQDFLIQFTDWLNSPILREQRLRDDPHDRKLRTYFHWIQDGVDFLYLDNASPDQFDAAQMKWIEATLKRAAVDPSVRTVVVGMHAVLPESLAAGHSMNDWAVGVETGRRVYVDLLNFQKDTGKKVYVLASHSHFLLANVFNSQYWREHGGVLPGWIVGTAGAFRYKLPPDAAQAAEAKTNVYGYLLGTANPDGTLKFEFHEITEQDVPAAVVTRFGTALVHQCFVDNHE
ncbi:MAG TPA: hypothetical protein VFM10_05335, partial [Terriglobales bacterium]|nr:hypothetical protein [Terriglobales bacterium]